MAMKENISAQRRFRSSFFTSVLSISLVLFLIGIVGFLVMNANNIRKSVVENIGINIELKDGLRDADMQQFRKIIDAREYTRSSEYISKEEAALETERALGEDFIAFLGYNPLPTTIKVKLKAPYANPDSIFFIEQELARYDQVSDIYYKKTLLHEINDNVKKISLVILSFSVLLFLVALALINNTIRLRVYAKRFLIHTMQLVGATRGFIRKPFLWTGVAHGALAGLIAIALLIAVLYIAQNQVEEILYLMDFKILGLLFLGVIVLGILMSLISTFFAVNKYLNISKDELYYR
jgi:cell division transport system permease protein